jgi:sensor histidine kinase YesM
MINSTDSFGMEVNKKSLPFKRVQIMMWMLIAGLNFFLFYSHQHESPGEAFNYAFIKTATYAIVIYGNALWLIPAFFKTRKYFTYILLSVGLISMVSYICMQELVWAWMYFRGASARSGRPPKDYTSTLVLTSLFFIFSIAFRYALDFFNLEKKQAILQSQHTEAQLNLLKAQVQPHFLFNTLNNIYYVAQLESPLTADLVEKLSNIMRYFLEEGPKKLVLLSTEFDFIKNYIDLEKIRMRYPLKTSMNLGQKITGLVKIPPMLLIPLVENVFKHGIDKTEQDNFISIDIENENKFTFKVKNKSYPNQKSESFKGTGLKNLRARLDILYGMNYSLKTTNESGVFCSELIIPV